MFLLPLPLLFAGLGAIGRGSAPEMLGELGGFAGLMLSAWLLNEGLRAEEAYDARAVARPPAIPRKLFAAVLTGVERVPGRAPEPRPGPRRVRWPSASVAGAAHLARLRARPDAARRASRAWTSSPPSGSPAPSTQAEALVRQITDAAARIGDRRLEGRVERLCDQAREVFRAVEQDPRDLSRARTFLSVYLLGLRDATVKFADVWSRSRDPEARTAYEALLGDLETSFTTHRTLLLEDDRSDLDIEIEVLRERLQQDGLIAR